MYIMSLIPYLLHLLCDFCALMLDLIYLMDRMRDLMKPVAKFSIQTITPCATLNMDYRQVIQAPLCVMNYRTSKTCSVTV